SPRSGRSAATPKNEAIELPSKKAIKPITVDEMNTNQNTSWSVKISPAVITLSVRSTWALTFSNIRRGTSHILREHSVIGDSIKAVTTAVRRYIVVDFNVSRGYPALDRIRGSAGIVSSCCV